MAKIHFFHSIGPGGEESARVRQYLVEHQLAEQIEFHNVMYEGSQSLMRELTGLTRVPCMVAGAEILVGAAAIVEWFEIKRGP